MKTYYWGDFEDYSGNGSQTADLLIALVQEVNRLRSRLDDIEDWRLYGEQD